MSGSTARLPVSRPTQGPLLLAVCFGLLVTAWTMSTPPGSAPDEREHYLRAAAAGRGQVVLSERPAAGSGPMSVGVPWQLKQSRVVKLPQYLSPRAFECRAVPARLIPCAGQPGSGAGSVKFSTYVGTYPPLFYLPAGVVMRPGRDAVSALGLGRLALALVSIAFLAAGVSAVWDRRVGALSLLGTVAVTTPMVLYTSSTLSPSGPELASASCFFSCALRVVRPGPAPRWVWTALGLSALALANARDLGPLWVVGGGLAVMAFAGPRLTAARVRAGGGPAATALLVAGFGLATAVVWQLAVQVRPGGGMAGLPANLVPGPGLLKAIYFQMVGNFGVLDTPMPLAAYAGWSVLIGTLTLLALWLGSTRQRLVLLAMAAGTMVLIALLDAIQKGLGFGVQGRHVLPMWIGFGLLAGEVLVARREQRSFATLRRLPLAFAVPAGGIQAIGWYTAARRYSVGLNGPWTIFAGTRWSPLGGWVLWASVVGTAVILGVMAAFDDRYTSRQDPAGTPHPGRA